MDELFRFGLYNAAWAAVLALVAAVGSRLWRGRPAVCHALWLLVLLKLASPSVLKITFPWPEAKAADRQVIERFDKSRRLAPAEPALIAIPPGAGRSIAATKSAASNGRTRSRNEHVPPTRIGRPCNFQRGGW